MVEVEFTIEPFIEGHPGAHVTAAIDAVQAAGVAVDVGPFGSSCVVEPDRVGGIVAAITDAAILNGASHVSIHVGQIE